MKYYFKVTDSNITEELLEKIYKLGYSWRGNGEGYKKHTNPYIFLEEDTGKIRYSKLHPNAYKMPNEMEHYKSCNMVDLYFNLIPKFKKK